MIKCEVPLRKASLSFHPFKCGIISVSSFLLNSNYYEFIFNMTQCACRHADYS